MGTVLLYAVVLLLLVPTIYYGVPNVLTARRPQHFQKVEPNEGYLVMRGGKIVRVLLGTNFVLHKKDGKYHFDTPEGFWVLPRKPGEGPEIGGDLSRFIRYFDQWMHLVTGVRVIAATFADLFAAKLATYDLNRPEEARDTMKGKPDVSNHVLLTNQVFRFEVKDAETGGTGVVKLPDGKEINYRSRISASFSGQQIFQVLNLWLVFFVADKYYDVIRTTLEAAFADKTRNVTVDELYTDAVKEKIAQAPINRNGTVPNFVKTAHAIPEELSGKEDGTAMRFGFIFKQVLIDQVILDPKYLEAINAPQQEALAAETARIALDTANLKAKASAAPAREKLAAIGDGLGMLREKAGFMPGDRSLADIAIANEYGATAGKGATLFINAGGVAQQPTGVIPLVPSQDETEKKPKKPEN